MLNGHEALDEGNAKGRDQRETPSATERPMVDREVPLPGIEAADAQAGVINQWLDGEASEADARLADEKSVQFWMKTAADTDRMGRLKTPSHVMANIMAAIPVKEPSAIKPAPRADRADSEAR
jgi:hypothetical protein